MFLIFYLYPAEIFDSKIIGPLAETDQEVSLKAFLGLDGAFKQDLADKGFRFERKLAGWMILIIIMIGMPLMFAYRSMVSKNSKDAELKSEEAEETESTEN